jgi:hypothetical protein
MADDKPPQSSPEEESKKDTVRINLPPGLASRVGGPGAAPTAKLKPPTPIESPEEEAKKETAVMGTPAATPKPKKDTSRVQVTAAKPVAPEIPRPTVKLKREDAVPSPAPSVGAGSPAPATGHAPAVAVVAAPSGADMLLSVAAIVLSVAVLVYLAMLATG